MIAGFLMVTLAAASWGTWSLFLRPTGLPPQTTAPLVMLAIGLAMVVPALRGPRVTWDRATVGLLLLYVAVDSLNFVAFFAAIETTTVSIAVLTHYLAPIVIALAAPWVDKVPARGSAPAAAVALAGLAVILEPWRAPAAGTGDPLLGAALGVTSALGYAGSVFLLRRLTERIGAPRAMSYHALIAAVALAPLAIGGLGAVSAGDLALLAAGGATIGAVSGVVFAIGLVRIGAARAAVLPFAEPLVAVAVGTLVWDEPLHPIAAVGGAMVLGAGIHVARKAR